MTTSSSEAARKDRPLGAIEAPIPKAKTCIAGFDEITKGGLPAGRTTLVVGGPGAGKTIFALQGLVNAAHKDHEPGIFVALEESSRQIIANAATFGWDLPALERQQLFFLDARLSPATVKSGDFDISVLLAGLATKAKEMNAKRIVFDGLDVLLTLLDDPVKERREVYRLHEWLKELGLTAVLTAKASDIDRAAAERYSFMQFMVDSVVLLHHRLLERVSLRSIRVMKYRGSSFAEGEFPMVIAPTGIEVATFDSSELEFNASFERVSSGVPRLDTMLDGGYYRGSGVLISGAPGTSKTTLAGAFAQAACKRGERVLFVSFDEAGSQIIRNLKSVGMDLSGCHAKKMLDIYAIRTEALSSEEHLITLKRRMKEFQPRNLIIDPLSALGKTGGHVAAVHASLRLLDYARAQGITTLCTSLVDSEGMSETTTTQISTIADTWIHLSYIVRGGERNRALTIVKSRGMKHSNQVRELLLSNEGVTLADVYTAGGEVLVGTSRWEHEARTRMDEESRRTERARRRRAAEQAQAKLASQIAALQAELETHRIEAERYVEADDAEHTRRIRDHAELLRRRYADPDTTGDDGARNDGARAKAAS
jgi:circadian clock protein KaiC